MATSGKQKGNSTSNMSTSSETTIAQNQCTSLSSIPKMDSVTNISEENDRNSSPSKTTDPARKKTFQIIRSSKKGASGDTPADNDADSVDGLDESQTEDWSSEFCDSSKATDLDTDAQDNLTPDEVTTTTILVKQKPDRDSQSRFKVVKIETKEPFRRGRWLCHDFFDTAPEVTLEKNGSKVTADSIMSAISVNLSSSNSVHYVNDSSRNIFVPLSPVTELSKVFVPITPVITDQVLSNVDGFSTDNMVPFPSQPALLTSSGALSSSSSYQNIVHPGQGQTTLVQSLPQTNVFPYTQNASGALFQNGIIGVPTSGQSNQTVNVPDTSMLTSSGNTTAVLPNVTVAAPAGNDFIPASQDNSSVRQGSTFMHVGGVHAPQSQGSGQLGSGVVPQKMISGQDSAQNVTVSNSSSISTVATAGTTGHLTNAAAHEPVTVTPNSSSAVPEQPGLIGIGMDESTGSTKTLQGDSQLPTSGLYEAVEAVYMELDNNEDDTEENGTSTVAIDNKIEQAMDLVKRHLMYAVREEVEILKQKIGDLMERITQLEYENSVLKNEAKPETLAKLLTPRSQQQPPQAAGQTPNLVLQQPQAGQAALQTAVPSQQPQASMQTAGQQQSQQIQQQQPQQIQQQPPQKQPPPQQQQVQQQQLQQSSGQAPSQQQQQQQQQAANQQQPLQSTNPHQQAQNAPAQTTQLANQ